MISLNLFCILLLESVYLYEYMNNDQKSFNEKTLPEKEEFYSNLDLEKKADFIHTKRVCKDFVKKLGEYHDFYLKKDTFLTDAFKTFRKMFLKIYHLDPVTFLSAPELAWQQVLKGHK